MSTAPPPKAKHSPLRLGRFERRVLASITAVAVMPLIGALVLGRGALEGAFEVGMNSRVQVQLDHGIEAHQQWLVGLRHHADRTADAIAWDYRLVSDLRHGDAEGATVRLEDAIARHRHVVHIRIENDRGALIVEAHRSGDGPAAEERREIQIEREIEASPDLDSSAAAGPMRVLVTIAAPEQPYTDYQLGGDAIEVYRHLRLPKDRTADIVYAYVGVYIALLLSVVVVALAAGIILSRRVTRRVVMLADATQKVGSGDLSVEVPTDEGDEVGELTRAFNAMVRDIRSSRDRIEYLQRVGAWQEMARRLAHEIKNPLTPIQLAVQELHRSYRGDDAKYRRTLEDVKSIVEEEVTTLRRLVREFGDFARLPEPALEPAELGTFVREATRGLDPAALSSEDAAPVPGLPIPEIQLEIDREELPVKVDAQMLRRCLDNLVRNAVQAIAGSRASSGPGGRVVVAARRDGNEAVLEVRDDGPGVAPENRERIFDPYYTTRAEGTGLGLAIVKKVVLEHGGTISCVEAREGGAAFRIHLPISRERARAET